MKSKLPGIRARAAFTLLEVMVAMGIGLMVSGGMLYAYMGANRSQGLTVGSSMLKQSGQASLNDVYKRLNQARHVFTRTDGPGWLAKLPIDGYGGGLSPGPTITPSPELVLPLAEPSGSFLARLDNGASVPGGQELGSDNVDFHPGSVGNALFFLSKEPRVTFRDVANGVQDTAFNTIDFNIHSYRFQFYYLVHRQLPVTAMPVRTGDNFIYQLMRWDSEQYLDRREIEEWMKALIAQNPGNVGGAHAFIVDRLGKAAARYPGALDLGQATPNAALFKLDTTDYVALDSQPAAQLLVSGHFGTAVKLQMRTSFGESFVAFNNVAGSAPAVKPPVPITALSNANERIPTYATPTDLPYGFEVMIAGPPASQRVLVRLALAARTQPGNNLIGETYQQLTQTFEY
ncbi:MAG: hypothetical protein JWM80_1407 [Cyanobacteria bacterium RYN_339]|nr:hypothetical protein [Cyanobacteria bacterium RYN_339]